MGLSCASFLPKARSCSGSSLPKYKYHLPIHIRTRLAAVLIIFMCQDLYLRLSRHLHIHVLGFGTIFLDELRPAVPR